MISLHVETFKDEITSIGAICLFQPPEHRHFIAQKEFYEELRVMTEADVALRDPVRKLPERALKEFFAWAQDIHDATLAGFAVNQHTVSLKTSCEKNSAPMIIVPRILELQDICYINRIRSKGVENSKLFDLAEILGYAGLASAPSPCNSLEQARLESEVLSRLMHGKSLYKAYCKEQFPVPEYIL